MNNYCFVMNNYCFVVGKSFECTIKCAIESRKSLNYQIMTRPL